MNSNTKSSGIGRKHGAWSGVAIVLAIILSPLAATADGLAVRTKQTQGPFIVTIFATPEASRDLRTDVMVMIQRRDSGEVMMDAAVDLSFVPPAGEKLSPNDVLCGPSPSQPGSIRALRAQAENKFFYGIPVVLRAAGDWQLRATIRQGGEEATVTCTLSVGRPPHPLRALWPYLALPPAAILLFAMNQWLRQRTSKAVRVGFERREPGKASFLTWSNAGEGLIARDVSDMGQGRIAKLRHAQSGSGNSS